MLLRNGRTVDLVDNIIVIRASISCCKWCGWRTVRNYDSLFAGCYPIIQDPKTKAVVPKNKLFSVTTEATGSLHAHIDRWGTNVGFAPVDVVFRSYMEKAREVKKQFGVIPHKLSYDMLTARFFTERPSIYQKVLVKLDGANINDTIRFDYKGRQYEAFIREILPTGLDWYAVAFVVESEKPASTIIISSTTLWT